MSTVVMLYCGSRLSLGQLWFLRSQEGTTDPPSEFHSVCILVNRPPAICLRAPPRSRYRQLLLWCLGVNIVLLMNVFQTQMGVASSQNADPKASVAGSWGGSISRWRIRQLESPWDDSTLSWLKVVSLYGIRRYLRSYSYLWSNYSTYGRYVH